MSNIDKLKISIVTPVYNGEPVIKDLINSVLDQPYTNWEMIIQDGQSDDNTLEIVSSFEDERIKVYSEKDNGMYDALNKAINKVTGEYIIHLNSDEQLIDDALVNIVKEINQNPNNDVYCFGVLIINSERIPKVFRSAYPQIKNFIKLYNFDILTAGIVYKKKVFKNLNFNIKYKAIADGLLFIEILENYRVYYSKIYSSMFLIEGLNLSLESEAEEERKQIRKSVPFSNLCYLLFYPIRKIFKLYNKCFKYTGSKKEVRIYMKGKKFKKSLKNISYQLNWEDFQK